MLASADAVAVAGTACAVQGVEGVATDAVADAGTAWSVSEAPADAAADADAAVPWGTVIETVSVPTDAVAEAGTAWRDSSTEASALAPAFATAVTPSGKTGGGIEAVAEAAVPSGTVIVTASVPVDAAAFATAVGVVIVTGIVGIDAEAFAGTA
jgi:hypothetical protein